MDAELCGSCVVGLHNNNSNTLVAYFAIRLVAGLDRTELAI